MVERAELLAEAYGRGLLPPDKKAAYEQAISRGLLPNPKGGKKPSVFASEIGGAVDRLKADVKTAYSAPTPEQRAQQKRPIAGWQKALGGQSTTESEGDRLMAADRIGTDVYDVVTSPIRGAVRQFINKPIADLTNIPEDVIGAVEMAGLLALGQRPIALKGGVAKIDRMSAAAQKVTKGQDPKAMTQRALEFRQNGVSPTLTDVVDDSGRGTIRAAASRQTPGRQTATNFGDNRAADLPSRMSGQARRVMSSDARTPDQIREATSASRRQNADAAFGAVRGETVTMAPETVQALRNPMGKDAIAEAARRERDPEVRAALGRLATDALDAPNTPITVGMADRISRTLYGRAQAAARQGDNDLAATFTHLGDAVRSPVKTASPGYGKALEGYAADSKLVDAAATGESLLTRNTDEFAAAASGLDDQERTLALASGRRAIERKSGENPSAARGVARQIADAPEQQARNKALLGGERAVRLQDGMRLEERAVRNAQDIAPRSGSQTQLREQDAATFIEGAARVGDKVLKRDWLGIGMDWLRSRGISDDIAEQVVHLSTDPAKVDETVRLLVKALGSKEAKSFLDLREAALATSQGEASRTASLQTR